MASSVSDEVNTIQIRVLKIRQAKFPLDCLITRLSIFLVMPAPTTYEPYFIQNH